MYYNGTFEEFIQEIMLWCYIIGMFFFELLWVFLNSIRR